MRKFFYSLLAFLAVGLGSQAQTFSVAGDVEALSSGDEVSFNVHIEGVTSMTSTHFEVMLPMNFSVTAVNATSVWTAMYSHEDGVISGISTSDNALTGEGDIATVVIQVPDGTAEGIYPVTINNVRVNGENLSATVEFNINVVDRYTILLDETSTTVPVAATNVNAVVKRTINANEWSTICLPFAMSEAQVKAAFGDGVQLADFVDYDYDEEAGIITVNFADATAIEANHPYIIKVSAKVVEFTVEAVDIEPEDNPCVEYDNGLTGKKRKVFGTFAGTYVADFDFYNDAENYPLFLSGNKFYYATENTWHMKAFRGYFDFVDYLPEAENASTRILMSFNCETTSAKEISNHKSQSSNIYDLQGRSVLTPSKGLYIKDGRKEVIK